MDIGGKAVKVRGKNFAMHFDSFTTDINLGLTICRLLPAALS